MSEEEEVIPENTCETIQITPEIKRLFENLETEYDRLKEEIRQEVLEDVKKSLKPKSK